MISARVRLRPKRCCKARIAAADSPAADAVRQEFVAHLTEDGGDRDGDSQHGALHRRALDAARQEVLTMRANNEIGDDAFHRIEEELDWLEMAGRTAGRNQ